MNQVISQLVSYLSKTNATPLWVDILTLILLICASVIAYRAFRESQRQTELEKRPYLRVAWVSEFAGENRRPQGITDSCLVLCNEGRGLMRKIHYRVWLNAMIIPLRQHAIIKPGGQTNIVYDDSLNKYGPALGDRNDRDQVNRNNVIIGDNHVSIIIKGSYEDVTGKKYQFGFSKNLAEQSWFQEDMEQKQIRYL